MCSFQCCSDRDKSVRQYDRQTGIAKIWTRFGKNCSFEFFSFTRLFICKKNFGFISFGFPTITLQGY